MDEYGFEPADGLVADGQDHHEHGRVVIAVGEMEDWNRSALGLPPIARIVTVAFGDLSPEVLERYKPDIVISPLLSERFDCVDLAKSLGALGYSGRYVAFGSGLPDPSLVAREVRALVPWLDFDVVTDGTAP